MLKIKNNVNLKELEKFGFTKNYCNQYSYVRKTDNEIPMYEVYITKKHRYIQFNVWHPCKIAGKIQDILYDLIKANMVEKVEDKWYENIYR